MTVCFVQLFGTQELELREEVASLRQEKQELRYNVRLLEEDNQTLRDELQQLRGTTSDSRSRQVNGETISHLFQILSAS